ncbi:DUF4232 domain-containing protein [Streptacidiphilus sp. PAMC 29251]
MSSRRISSVRAAVMSALTLGALALTTSQMPQASATTVRAATTVRTATSTASCTGSNTKLTVTRVASPRNHLLIKVTNTGRTTCDAYYYPYIGFTGDQATTQSVEASIPQAVVVLAPGRSAYAGVRTLAANGKGAHRRTVRGMSLYFASRNQSGSVGKPLTAVLAKGTQIDDSAAVTYWQTTAKAALAW